MLPGAQRGPVAQVGWQEPVRVVLPLLAELGVAGLERRADMDFD